jgi:restriction endonuclease Mrr
MNETERADTIRGFKALAVLVSVPIVLLGLWQSIDHKLFNLLSVVTFLAFVAWVWWRYRRSRALSTLPATPARKFQSLFDQYQGTIATYRNRIRLSGSFEIENLVRDCIGEIAQQHGRSDVAPHGEYLYKWERRSDIPNEYRRLAEELKANFRERAEELSKIQNEQIAARAEQKLSTNRDLVEKFIEITERKVSVLDDYGDEHWDALPDEILKLLKKINERDHEGIRWEFIKRTKGESWVTAMNSLSHSGYLPQEYTILVTRLQQLFQEHHQKISADHPSHRDDLQDLSGVEFETYIARLLRSAGYDVQGTPTTGDQGADLIAKKDGRTVIIQAKRYEGTVGNKAIQEVNSAVSFYGGTEGWVITNSTFTPSAIALAQKTNIKLVDGTGLKNKPFF